ncbi:uncharacterized protein LOC128223306 [Mya arenaria]|uniref:uncharacterized protein LOC128223306 n=1 Tax=Mya arenaria TaxID=6604 RepID=UPI0022E71590|nr:uncharacterized protein LOC128223306 [Mya arenaria]
MIPVGPLSTLIPEMFHQHLTRITLKSYLAATHDEYTETVYGKVLEYVNDLGRVAVERIHPWVLNVLIDLDGFDHIICSEIVEDDQIQEEPSSEHHPQTSRFIWSTEIVKVLIDLHTEKEELFKKPSVKKISVWKAIAQEINKISSTGVSPAQCEQKWKNIIKKFRDTIDHNKKSGSDRKECPFYNELQHCYGYKPNVHPQFTAGSSHSDAAASIQHSESVDLSQQSEGVTEDASIENTVNNGCIDVNNNERRKPKRMKKNDEIVNVLKNIQTEMKNEQHELIKTLQKHHEERMKVEEKRLDLLASLVSSIKK